MDDKDARIARLEAALRFYSDERRYRGPNVPPIEDDPYCPEIEFPYQWDITRDGGRIAKRALEVTKSSTYVVTFDRVGRSRDVAPLTVTAEDEDDLAHKILKHVVPHLRSRQIEVSVDVEAGTGQIVVGAIHNGGDFVVVKT